MGKPSNTRAGTSNDCSRHSRHISPNGCSTASLEKNVQILRTYNTVQQALKKHVITVFEAMYLDILNDDMVGFAKISAREMLYHLSLTYWSTIAVDLEHNF
jgi:hypothetical protein